MATVLPAATDGRATVLSIGADGKTGAIKRRLVHPTRPVSAPTLRAQKGLIRASGLRRNTDKSAVDDSMMEATTVTFASNMRSFNGAAASRARETSMWASRKSATTRTPRIDVGGFDMLHKSLEVVLNRIEDMELNDKWKRVSQYLDAYQLDTDGERLASACADAVVAAAENVAHFPDGLLGTSCAVVDQALQVLVQLQPAWAPAVKTCLAHVLKYVYTNTEDLSGEPLNPRNIDSERIKLHATNFCGDTWQQKARQLDAAINFSRAAGTGASSALQEMKRESEKWKVEYMRTLFTGWRMQSCNEKRLAQELEQVREQGMYDEVEYQRMLKGYEEMREAHATMKAKVKSMELEMSQMQTREERLFEERMRKDDTIQHLQHQQQGLMKELRQAKEKLETALAKIEHKDTSQHKARVWNLVDEPQGALQGLDLKDVVSAFDEGTRGEYRLMKCRTESSVVNGLLVFLRYSLPDFAGAEVGNALSAGSPRDTETKIAAIMAAFRALDLPNLDAVRSLLRSALHKSNLTASHNYPLYALIAYLGKVTMYSLDLKEADKRKFQKETGWKEPGVSASWRAIDMIEALVDATSVRPVGQDIGIQCNEVEQCDEEEEALFTHYADKLDLDLDGDVLPTDAAQAEGYLNAIRQCLKECIGGLHSVFMYYCSSDKKYHGMNEHEFWRFCRDLEVYKNCADQRTRVKKIFLVALSGEDHTEGPGRSELSQSGWVKTLIWMANETMASYGRLPERVAAFVDRILANSKRFKVQGFRNMIYGKQVQRVADAFRKRLLRVFHVYSDRDRKMMTQSAFKSLCKDAVLIDSIFTHDAVQDVFQHSQLEEEDDGMLIFSEFQEALIAIALYKNPNPYTSMDRRVEYFFEKQLLLPLKHKLK